MKKHDSQAKRASVSEECSSCKLPERRGEYKFCAITECGKQIVGKRMRIFNMKGFTFLFAHTLLVLNGPFRKWILRKESYNIVRRAPRAPKARKSGPS